MANLGGTAQTEIDAPIDVVYKICEDVATSPDWQANLKRVEPLEYDEQGRPTLAKSVADASVKEITTTVRFSYTEPTEVRWEQVKGDIKSLVGSWTLEDLGGDRTRATYTLDGDPGRMLGMLIRGPVEGKVREILVDGRPDELKKRVAQG